MDSDIGRDSSFASAPAGDPRCDREGTERGYMMHELRSRHGGKIRPAAAGSSTVSLAHVSNESAVLLHNFWQSIAIQGAKLCYQTNTASRQLIYRT